METIKYEYHEILKDSPHKEKVKLALQDITNVILDVTDKAVLDHQRYAGVICNCFPLTPSIIAIAERKYNNMIQKRPGAYYGVCEVQFMHECINQKPATTISIVEIGEGNNESKRVLVKITPDKLGLLIWNRMNLKIVEAACTEYQLI